ncbi:hypothetical protein AGMMS49992_12820 [Clostridia bacterium]|nr:hypothetical protein AGMMS49992_12820 [Clostridia bacterium]
MINDDKVRKKGSVNTKANTIRRIVVIALMLALITQQAFAAIAVYAPTVRVAGQVWELKAKGSNVKEWTVRFDYKTYTVAGSKLSLPLTMPRRNVDPETAEDWDSPTIPLEIEATLANGKKELITRGITYGTAREALIADWIASIQLDDGTQRKSGTLTSPGQCKRYLINAFADVSAAYELAEHPGITLYMPERPNDEKSGRVQGAAWILPLLGTGNPFVEIASYDFSQDRTSRENKQAARAFLESVQPGDVVQLMAIYNNGARGTHTLLITAPYDPMKDMLYWSDSNFRNKMIDGVRYGTVMAYQSRTVEAFVEWLVNPACAATIYRLVDGIQLRESLSDPQLQLYEEESK